MMVLKWPRLCELSREVRGRSGRVYPAGTVVRLRRRFGEGGSARDSVRVLRNREVLMVSPDSVRAFSALGLTPREEIALAPAWVREALRGSAPESASAAFALLAILALLWVMA